MGILNVQRNRLRASGVLVIVPGVALVIFGLLAIMSPVLTSFAVVKLLGTLLLAAGVFRAVSALHASSRNAGLLGFTMSALAFVGGLLMLSHPVLAAGLVTLLLAVYLIADGALGGALAFENRPEKGWGWLLASATASITLGAMILFKWPTAGLYSVAAIVGVFLVLSGASLIQSGITVHSAGRRTDRDSAIRTILLS